MSDIIDIVLRIKDQGSGAVKEVTKSLKDLDKEAQGTVSRGLSGLQDAVGVGLKAAVGIGTAAIVGFGAAIASSVGKAANMEQGVADIAATMGLTADETSKVKKLISDLGLDPKLKVDATQAAQAIGVLGTAGFDVNEIMEGAARSTVLLANSTGAAFGQAGSIISDVSAQFDIDAKDMAGAVNAITGVTVASKFGINDYADAIAQSGGVASSVGLDFDDFNAILAATAFNFKGGADGGTGLKTFLTSLIPNSNAAADAMRDLGLYTGLTGREFDDTQGKINKVKERIAELDPTSKNYAEKLSKLRAEQAELTAALVEGGSAFFDANGMMRSGEEIQAALINSTRGLSEAKLNDAFTTIFGQDASRTAFALIKEGVPTIEEMKAVIGNTNAEESAATRMNTFSGAIEIAKGVVDTISMSIGDKFLPVLRPLVERFTELAQVYGPQVIDWFGKLADSLGVGIEWLLRTVETGTIFNEVFASLPMPIQGVITTVTSLIDRVQSVIKPIVDTISQFISWKDVLAAVGVVIATMLYPAITTFLGAISPAIGVFAGLVAASALLRTAWTGDWQGIVDTVKTLLPQFMGKLQEWGAAAWQWIQDIIPVVMTTLGKWATSIFGWLRDNLPNFLKTILQWGTALYTWIGDAIPKAIDGLSNYIKGLREQGDGSGKSSLMQMAGSWATTLWKWIKEDLIPAVGPAFSDFIRAMLNYGSKLVVSLGNLAKELGLLLWQWIVEITPIALKKISDWGGELWGWIKDNAPAWKDRVAEWGAIAWQWIRDIAIPEATKKLGEWGTALWNWLKENAPIWRENLAEWAKAAWEWITLTAIPATLTKLGEWGTNLVEWVKTNAPIWGNNMLEAGKEMIEQLRDGIEIAWIRLTDWFFSDTAFGGFVGDILAMLGLQLGPAYGVMYEDGKKITYSLNEGSRYGLDALRQTGSDMGSALSSGLKTNLDMHSPSRVMWGYGEDVTTGLVGGVREGISALRSEMQYVADTIKATMQQANNEMLAGIEYFTNQAMIKAQAAHTKIANAAIDAGAILKQLGIDTSNSIGLGPNGELILKGITNLPKTTNKPVKPSENGTNFVPDTKEITTLGQALGLDKVTAQTQGTSLNLLGGITLQTADLKTGKENLAAATTQATKTAEDFIGGFVDFLKGTLEGAGSVFNYFKVKEETAYREGDLQKYIGSETAQTKVELKGLYQGIQNSIADLLGISSSDLNVTSGDSLRLIDRVKQVLAGTTIDSNMEFVGGLLQDLVNFRTLANTGTGKGYFDSALPTDSRLTGGNTTNTYNINLMGTSNPSADIMNTVQLLNQLQVTAP